MFVRQIRSESEICSLNVNEEQTDRYWQNWDNGDASKRIDEYWMAEEEGWRNTLIVDLAREFGKPTVITEIGCGSGLIFQAMKEQDIVTSGTYTGGDISQSMLKIARERYPEAHFRELDIFNLDLPDNSQPNVINIHVLQHLPHYDQAIKELLRIAREKLYIACWFTQQPQDEITFCDPSERWDNQRFQNNCYSLPKFVSCIIANSQKPLADMRIHRFGGQNYSICLSFIPANPGGSATSGQPSVFAKVKRRLERLLV